jgi:two-component system sensor histidine kinase PhoQ
MLKQGERRFENLPIAFSDDKGVAHQVYRFSYGVGLGQGEVGQTPTITRFTIALYEDAAALEQQVGVFRRALWGYLGLARCCCCWCRWSVLRWSLQPLRQLEHELARVRRGVSDRSPDAIRRSCSRSPTASTR